MPGVTIPYTQRFFVLLELLKTESDINHRFQQTTLAEILSNKYQMPIDRRSVKKALDEMRKVGYPVVYNKGWYYNHEFTDAELNFLCYSIRCNDALPPDQQEQLLSKLSNLSSRWYTPPNNANNLKTSNVHFLDTLSVISSAIDEGLQLEFIYGNYDTDFQLHPRLNRAGNIKQYVINPYEIATVNGRYYLIANINKYNSLSHYRIDRIIDIKIRRKKSKPLSFVEGHEILLDLPKYISQHSYMYSGEPHEYHIRTKRSGINDVLDWFGTDVSFDKIKENEVDVKVKSDSSSMEFWLKRYSDQAYLIQENNLNEAVPEEH